MMVEPGSFQIKGMELSRVMPGVGPEGMCGGVQFPAEQSYDALSGRGREGQRSFDCVSASRSRSTDFAQDDNSNMPMTRP